MTTIINGSSPSITFSDSTTQTSGYGSGTSQFVSSQMPSGSILQVVNAIYNASTSSNTTTYTDTGLAATITPKFSTSKIFVIVSANGVYKDTNNTWAQLRTTLNGSVDAYMGSFMAYNNSSNANSIGTVAIHYFSFPATTSACTYKLQLSSANGANVYINCSAQDTSSITLMEIA